MTSEHPDFPQDYAAHPVFKYLVEQLAKFEDASNCTLGYYNNQKKINERIDKLNIEINKLHLAAEHLEKTTRSDIIAKIDNSNFNSKRIHDDITKRMEAAIEKLDSHIQNVDSRVFPPMWKIWIYMTLSLIVGIGIGKFL